jgi:hypothetical protein
MATHQLCLAYYLAWAKVKDKMGKKVHTKWHDFDIFVPLEEI